MIRVHNRWPQKRQHTQCKMQSRTGGNMRADCFAVKTVRNFDALAEVFSEQFR